MPELPEVEVIRQGLAPLLGGRRVVGVGWSTRKLRLPVPRRALTRWVRGVRIRVVGRRAKYLLLHMANNATVVFHLGMSGKLGLFPARAPCRKHDHLRLRLDNGLELRFNDSRRFGSLQVLAPDVAVDVVLGEIGPEPLSDDLTPAYLLSRACNRRQPIKNFLMDSRTVAGIGNIYANEILFCAGIRPTTPAGDITESQWQRTIRCCRDVLGRAIASGGTTIADFVDASGAAGYFQLQLQVYGRGREKCTQCQTAITRQVLAGRATYFCPCCQPLQPVGEQET
jgi:formamidopyrimidine-DNA glycosylase